MSDTQISEEELAEFLKDKNFTEDQIKFVFDEIEWFGAQWFDKNMLLDKGFNMLQIRYLFKLFEYKEENKLWVEDKIPI